MANFTCCTIVARNYLPRARVLAKSLRVHHPECTLRVLVIDGVPNEPTGDEPFSTLSLGDIGLGDELGRQMAAIYSVLEFSTAVKAWLLTSLLQTTGRPVLYFDPDIEIFGEVGHLADLAAQHGVVVTPHHLRPLPRDGRTPVEADFLATGIYNLGFIGTGVGAIDSGFLQFWRERLERDALVDYPNMMFTDQRWVDFIGCFPHHVIGDPGCNVAYWNIGQRSLTRYGDAVSVDGQPLVFFHFSGFDPDRPHLLSVNQGERPRVFLSDHPVLAGLCRHYRDEVVAEGYVDDLSTPYGWSVTPAGLVMTPVYRRSYRSGLIEADRGAVPSPPNPYEDPQGFEAWIEVTEVGSTRLPLYLATLWTLHPDLQRLFVEPLINPHHAQDFCRWVVAGGDARAADVPDGLRGRLSSRIAELEGTSDSAETGPLLPGLNVLGYLHAELGVGQAARLVLSAAAAAGVPTNARSIDPVRGSLGCLPGNSWGDDWSFDTNVFSINADMLGTVIAGLPRSMLRQPHSAGIWFWEAERIPERFEPAFHLVDEVWAPSLFIAAALERTGAGPVVPISLPVPVPAWSTAFTRRDLGLPEGFLVLFTFDFASVFERKNPLGLLEAYCRAFDPDDGAHLVLKSVGGEQHWQQMELLRSSIDRPDIHVMDGAVPSHRLKAMMELSDCYASLHRSEGFGLGMAEAMALGKPVVATAWSANLEFMDEDTAYLVPAGAVPIPDDVAVYGGLGRWAEPDLDAAAAALRRVHDDPVGATERGARARRHMERTRSPLLMGQRLAAHAERLRKSRPAPAA
jgi:glycosyltransferase involved in cell wall biosynthesis